MAWKTMDVHEQRVRFVVAAAQKIKRFSALCAEYEISRPTGYVWLQRYRELGVTGIAEQSRRPHYSPRRTASELERQVVEVRLRYPDWDNKSGTDGTVPGFLDNSTGTALLLWRELQNAKIGVRPVCPLVFP